MRHVPPLRSPLIRALAAGRIRGPPPQKPGLLPSRLLRPRASRRRPRVSRVGDLADDSWSLRRVREGVKNTLGLHENTIRTNLPVRPSARTSRKNHRSEDNVKMRSHIQFITTPTADTPGTGLVLHFDDKRYFFGQVHEGLQRASLQHGSKLLKVREVFLTGKIEWQTTGGLLGMILSLADSAKASLESQKDQQRIRREAALRRAKEEEERLFRTAKPQQKRKTMPLKNMSEASELKQEPLGIHGGPNITHMLATARSFVFRQGMPMDVDEFREGTERTGLESQWQSTWKDEHVQVWAMSITPGRNEDGRTIRRTTDQVDVATPRKRSLGDYMSGQKEEETTGLETNQLNSLNSPEDQAQKVREHVVHEMFRSNWRFDSLVETPLAEVNLPAKLFIRNPETKGIKAYDGPLPDGTAPLPDITVLVRKPWPGALVTHLPPTKPSSTAMSYIVRNHKQRGKFMAKVAKELGVPSGPMNSQLARGENVTLKDGTIVTPEQVLEPGKEGGGVAIVDLPSIDYVSALLRRSEWYQEDVMKGVEAFVWILGPGVARDGLFLAFMHEFKDFTHILSSREHCPNQLMMTSAASASVRHHLVDPERYPLLQHHNTVKSDSGAIDGDSKFVAARPGLKLHLEPSVTLDNTEVNHPVNLVQALDEVPSSVYELVKQAKVDVAQSPLEDQDLPSPDAEVICLGTGSALPSQHRNVAGTLLRVPGCGSYLFDAGENSLGQLKRIYPPEELAEVLRDLKMIWISHLHADHHLGTAAVIRAWYEEVHGVDITKRPRHTLEEQLLNPTRILNEGRHLFVVGGAYMMRWLYEYSSVEDFGYDQIIPVQVTPVTPKNDHLGRSKLEWNGVDVGFESAKEPNIQNAMSHATGLTNLMACHVSHCNGAMAVSVTFPGGFKFSYSGDCRPSRLFASIGKGSTVLVHEATFDDEMQGDAQAKKHSTISEAIGVGAEMGARRVILTHFSQRYSKIPTMSDVQESIVKLEEVEAEQGPDEMVPVQEPPDVAVDRQSTVTETIESRSTNDQTTKESFDLDSAQVNPNIALNVSRLKDMKIAVAFDYMRVKVKDIASLEKFTPALRELYKPDEVLPVEDREKHSPAAAGGLSESSRMSNQQGKGGKRANGSKSGNKRKTAAADQDAESTSLPRRQ